MFGGLEVLQCYNPHKTGRFCTIGCYKGATEMLQVLQNGERKRDSRDGVVGRPARALWVALLELAVKAT